MSFVAACYCGELSVLLLHTLPENLGRNSYLYNLGCAHVPHYPLQTAMVPGAGRLPPGLSIQWCTSRVISLRLLP